MDPVDYLRLQDFLARQVPVDMRPNRGAAHIMCANDEPMSPGYSTVLVVWSESTRQPTDIHEAWNEETHFKVAVWGYCPVAEQGFARHSAWTSGWHAGKSGRDYRAEHEQAQTRHYADPFKLWEDSAIHVYRTGAEALAHFAREMAEHAENCGY